MNKVLLFDFDGTIADSYESFLGIVGKLAIKHKFQNLSLEELETLRTEDARTLIKQLKIPFYKLPFIAHDMKTFQQKEIQTMHPFKGLPEVLHTLKKQGHTLGIITSNGRANVETFIKKHAIDVFDYIYSDAGIFGKDKVLQNFFKQHHINKDDAFYIGDEIRDIQACKKVGVKIISVSWGFNIKAGLEKHHPNFLIDHPKDLLSVINS